MGQQSSGVNGGRNYLEVKAPGKSSKSSYSRHQNSNDMEKDSKKNAKAKGRANSSMEGDFAQQ